MVQRIKTNHLNDPADALLVSTNPDAIRGQEQIKIDENGGAQSKGGNSSNKINSISDKNPKKDQYKDAANNEFGGGQ